MPRGWIRHALLALALLGCGDDSSTTDAGTDSSTDSSTDGGVDSGIEYQMHDEIRVEADDGSATLIIAPNSLPVGVDASEIQVVAGALATLESSDGATLESSYELLPDGLIFGEPARLLVETNDLEASPLVLLIDDDVEAGPTSIEAQDAMGAISRVSAAIPHFTSLLLVIIHNAITPTGALRGVVERELTESPMQVDVEASSSTITTLREDARRVVIVRINSGLTGTILNHGHVRVSPIGDTMSSPFTLDVGPAAAWEPKFRCTEAGSMNVASRLTYQGTFDVQVETEARTTVEFSGSQGFTSTGTCHPGDPGNIDIEDDCTESEGPSVTCSFFDAFIDINETVLNLSPTTADEIRALFGNTAYPCDEFGGGLRTVCRATPGEFAEGAMWVGTMVLGTDVPDNDPDHSLIYSLVFDSDNVPDNDWVPVDPFVWDYFQGTDRWYQLIWNHLTSTWTVSVTQVDASQTQTDVPSAVRVVIVQNAVTFFIPVTELPSATPAYRFSAFAHDGSFSRTDRGGDVSGIDPTVPPQMFVP